MPRAAPMITRPAPIALRSENGAAPSGGLRRAGLGVSRTVGEEQHAEGQDGDLINFIGLLTP